MKRDLEKRLDAIEEQSTDWISRLPLIDYVGIEDYDDGWEEVHTDENVTVLRHETTAEIRGVFVERRSDDEIRDAGGDLAFL